MLWWHWSALCSWCSPVPGCHHSFLHAGRVLQTLKSALNYKACLLLRVKKLPNLVLTTCCVTSLEELKQLALCPRGWCQILSCLLS